MSDLLLFSAHVSEKSGFLVFCEDPLQIAALAFMTVVYTARILWLLSYKAGGERQPPTGLPGTTPAKGILYSWANIAMPWAMESTRTKLPLYAQFVIFHLGVVAGIFFAVVGSAYPPLVQIPLVAYILMGLIGAAFLVSVGRVIRRLARPVLRLISTPDDYFSLVTLTVWFGLGVPAVAHVIGLPVGEGYLVAYLFATSFFLVYVPFSKISHYLYYPFTRYWIGRTLGHRGSMPPAVARG